MSDFAAKAKDFSKKSKTGLASTCDDCTSLAVFHWGYASVFFEDAIKMGNISKAAFEDDVNDLLIGLEKKASGVFKSSV